MDGCRAMQGRRIALIAVIHHPCNTCHTLTSFSIKYQPLPFPCSTTLPPYLFTSPRFLHPRFDSSHLPFASHSPLYSPPLPFLSLLSSLCLHSLPLLSLSLALSATGSSKRKWHLGQSHQQFGNFWLILGLLHQVIRCS